MKKKYLLLILLIQLVSLSMAQITGDWRAVGPTNFPSNLGWQINGIARVPQFKFHPSNPLKMYAITATGGLYISNDGAQTWNATGSDNMFRTNSASICIDNTNDQIIYLGTGDANYYSRGIGIYKSTDGGASWLPANTGISNRLAIDIIMSPLDHNVLIAATDDGIWKTVDGGVTWTKKNSASGFKQMVLKPGTNSTTLYSVNDSQFWYSTDLGETWTQTVLPGSGLANGGRVAVTNADPNLVYVTFVGTFTSQVATPVLKSTDGGLSFSVVKAANTFNLNGYDSNSDGQHNYNYGICIDPANSSILYVVGHIVWRSTDGGATWTSSNDWAHAVHTDMHQVSISPYDGSKLFCANDGGIWLSTNGGVNWTPKSDGIAGLEIYHGAQSPIRKDMMDVGTQDNGELQLDNRGWGTNGGGDFGGKVAFDYLSSGYVYHLGSDRQRKSTVGDAPVFSLPFNPIDGNGNDVEIEFNPMEPNLAFVGQLDVYRTSNLSSAPPAWTKITSLNKQIKAIASSPANANLLYVVTNDGMMYRSMDALSVSPTFTAISLPAATNNRASIVSIKTNMNVVYVTCNSTVYRSSDKGNTWTNITENLPNVNIIKLIQDLYSTDESVYVGNAIGVYYRNNTMTTWQNHSNGLPTIANINDFMIFNDGTANSELRVAYYGKGVWGGSLYKTSAPLIPAENVSNAVNGVDYSYYQGNWTTLPDFLTLTPSKTGSLNSIDLSAKNAATQYAFVYTGYINVPFDGQYNFYVSSDDGSKFYIGNTLVVSNDGLHTNGAVEQSGTIGLKAGLHSFTLNYFQNSGSDSLAFSYELPGQIAKQQVSASSLYHLASVACSNTGFLYREQWNNIGGNEVSLIPVTTTPSSTSFITSFEGPTNTADNYGSRISGLLCAPYTGNYTFWISSDDNSELWLSTDETPANKVRIAQLFGAVNPRDWNATGSQKSAPIALVAGQRYYVEVLHKEGGGADHVAVGWQLPNGLYERPIPGNRILPLVNHGSLIAITAPDPSTSFAPGSTITITTSASAATGNTITKVEFYNNTTLLGAATTSPYNFVWTNVAPGKYSVTAKLYDNTGSITTSSSISINVGIATFYKHCNYDLSGYAVPLAVGSYTTAQLNSNGILDNDISSIGGLLSGYKIVAYLNDNFQGDSLVLTSNNSCLATNMSWNDVISSLKIMPINILPTVNISSPGSKVAYYGPANISLTADATDADGSILKVGFYNGIQLLGEVTTAPYTFNWTTVQPGNYVITAKATDNQGGQSSSPIINVAVITTSTNLALNKPVYASTTANATNLAKNAVDGDSTTTRWESNQADPQWIYVDLGNSYVINRVKIIWEGAYAKDYKVQVSNDAVAWTDIKTVTGNAVLVNNWTGLSGTGQYVRMYGTARGTGFGYSIYELQVYGSIPGNNILPSVSITSPANNSSYIAPASITLNANAADTDGTISKVGFYNGTQLLGEVTSSPYTYNWTGVAAGTYSITAKATDNLGGQTTSSVVNVNVINNQLPTVSITSPANNSSYIAPASITLNANAADSDGTISKVGFYNGTQLLGEVTSSPYTYNWTNVTAGTYSVTAKATDNMGGQTTSSVVTITVTNNQLPVVSITSPANNSSYIVPVNIILTASASDADGTISKVGFYNGTTLLAEVTTSPYTYNWTNVAAGTYSITAKATDNLGGQTTSSEITISVTDPNANLALNKPTYASSLENGGTAASNATDGSLSTRWASAWEDPQWIYVDLGATYNINEVKITWEGALGKDYLVQTSTDATNWTNIETVTGNTALVNDWTGLSGVGQYVRVYGTARGTGYGYSIFELEVYGGTSGGNLPPTVSITSPANNSIYVAPANITITANASDSDGTISKVGFYNGTQLLEEVSTSPYTYSWTGVAAGSFAITVKAYDNEGATTTSAAVNVTVNTANANLALNKPTYASSIENGGTAASNATDGSLGTRWASAWSDPQWIYVDLGATYSINEVKITWEGALGKDYIVQVSNDATTWNDVQTVTGNTVLVNDWTGLSVSGQYVRVYGTARGTGYGYSIYELEVYGGTSGGNLPPTVSITSPANNDSFSAPATISITANASDSDGSITKVEFYNGAQLLGAVTSSPYTYSWTGVAAGSYAITAKAYDNTGATTTSSVVNVTVNTANANLALNKPTYASSLENGGTVASNATDGSLNTRWSSAWADPQWIYVDLGATYSINEVKITWEGAYGKDYVIQVSTDAVTWSDMQSVTGNTVLVNDWTGLSGTGRYVRIYGTARGTGYGYSIYELEVYGTYVGAKIGYNNTLEFSDELNSVLSVYPNPTTEAANIVFNVYEPNEVLLTIYNNKGEKIKTLLQEKLGAGVHTLTWFIDASLPEGMYICTIQSGSRVDNVRINVSNSNK
jgi:hypothetical protein